MPLLAVSNFCPPVILADIYDKLTPQGVFMVVIYVVAGLTIAALVLTVDKLWRDRQPKPTPSDTMRELQEQLRGLAPDEKVNALVERLVAFVTREELVNTRIEIEGAALLREKLIRAETTLSLEQLRTDVRHDMKVEFHANNLVTEDYREGVHSRLNAITEVLFELRGRVAGHN